MVVAKRHQNQGIFGYDQISGLDEGKNKKAQFSAKEEIMRENFAIAEVLPRKLNAMVKRIMRQMGINDPNEAVRRINSEEWVVSKAIISNWRGLSGVISLGTFTSDGTTGSQWINRLELNGSIITGLAKDVLNSKSFKPTNGLTFEIVVLKGMLWEDGDRITRMIREGAYSGNFAGGNKLIDPNPEFACLIREKLSNKEIEDMNLNHIVVMHKSINDSDGDPSLLGLHCIGGKCLDTLIEGYDDDWGGDCYGFAFALAS